MNVPLLDLAAQYDAIRTTLDAAVERVVESQRFVLGSEVEELEAEVAAYAGVPHAVGVASGTDALILPLRALGLDPGDEVVVPAFTFFATAGAVWNAGLIPVFCDVDVDTFNMTAETLEAAWTPRAKAVIPVHLFGQMAPMDELEAVASRRGGVLVEDAAQAIGSRDGKGRMAGSVGVAGALSFFPTKNLGAFGDGGMVLTRDRELAERVHKLRVHGGRQMYHHEMVGTNSRLDALQAAVLRAKLPYLDEWAEARRRNAFLYGELLADIPDVVLPAVVEGSVHVYNQYTVRVRRRDDLRAYLADREIGSGVYYPVPLHLQPCFESLGMERGRLPVSEILAEQVLSLPIFPELGEERLRRVALAIREFFAAEGP